MDIHSLKFHQETGGPVLLSAALDQIEVHFRIEGAPAPVRATYDPFVLVGFLAAMENNGRLTVAGDAPVSAELVSNLAEASWIYTQWWPDLAKLTVDAGRKEPPEEAANEWVGVFFSGGVDSLYSFVQNRETVTHLILCRGLDISFEEVDRWEKTVEMVSAFAEQEGKGLVLVETDAKRFVSKTSTRNHGAVLVGTGINLGFGKLIVPASLSMDFLGPWGSHPMLDPLFSTGLTEVLHDSPVWRTTKIKGILDAGIGLDLLRVCNVFTEDVNCGRCEKCLRTRTALTLFRAGGGSLEPIEDPRELRTMRIERYGFLGAWKENLALAKRVGREDFAVEIQRAIRRFRTREALRQLDADYLGGALLRLKRKVWTA